MPASDTALAWFFGRGVAKAFGFAWRVPPEHYAAFEQGRISRRVFEDRIRSALARFQEQRGLDPARLERFLDALSPDREHRFVTTNWNTLLDRELAARGYGVWHLNGS
ncbi:MAG TPA: hypothetical protein VEB41_15030, partial [Burkholderiales bacterium]|nr:hypothetical protein [Burkholderiales bacterium]